MDLTKEFQQRKEFCDILFELAKSQKLLQDAYYRSNMYKRLESLYDAESKDKRFRHFYTDIFSVLTQIQQNSDLGDINILGQNLDMIRNGYKPQNKAVDGKRIIDVSDAIKKLYDHVNLDIARIAYSDGADRKISGESSIENLQSQINSMQRELQKAQEIKNDYEDTEKKIIDVENKLDNSQKEYITILGIFAAVVLAFTGGIAFSTSVLNNIAQASAYRTIAVALIIGLVLINVLFGLFYYVNSLVNKEKKIFPLVISNIVIIVLLIITFFAWNNGWIENRDKKIEHQRNIVDTYRRDYTE
ncbi:MAG: hypothetical protein PUG66_09405 [Clostridiales bacterium]|nr:hypothetical protein [Eubacterium sp.]MDD7350035.1 hypothetical protein [Clostridiales bacterium]